MVDHLFVFEGNGKVKDFPGNYSQYKSWLEERKKIDQIRKRNELKKAAEKTIPGSPNKLTYKEKQELESLELEIQALESEKTTIETGLGSGELTADEIHSQSHRYPVILEEIDRKTERWMELSEKV
jgi:ATP-binding cassette subfamily F protein uup